MIFYISLMRVEVKYQVLVYWKKYRSNMLFLYYFHERQRLSLRVMVICFRSLCFLLIYDGLPS